MYIFLSQDPAVLADYVDAGLAQHLPPPLPRHVHLRCLRDVTLQKCQGIHISIYLSKLCLSPLNVSIR